MKITANSIKLGNILVHNEELWYVSKMPEHTKPGKGPAYIQVEMKNLKTSTKVNIRFSSTENVERAQLEQRDFEFLYHDGSNLIFMDTTTFEQITLSKEMMKEKLLFLKDNMKVKIEFYQDTPINIELPPTIIAEIVETSAVIKGATVTSSYKPAMLDNGVRVMVPSYLTTGEKIIVKTEDSSFVERAK